MDVIRTVAVLLAVSGSLATGTHLPAQGYPVAPGEQVRVRLARTEGLPRAVQGRLLGADSTSLSVEHDGARMEVPLASIHRLEVSTGRRSAGSGAGRGALKGLAFGLIATALATGVAASEDTDGASYAPGVTLLLGLIMTAPITAAGALLGSAAPGQGWRRLEPLPAPLAAPLPAAVPEVGAEEDSAGPPA